MPLQRLGRLSVVAITVIAPVALAAAHHGIGRFDPTRNLTVEGTLTGLDFVNPRSYVHFNAAEPTVSSS